MPIQVTEVFSQRIRGAFGQEGAAWLSRLPELLSELSDLWGLSILDPYEDMAYNYVAPAVREDGSEVVIKVGVPRRELSTEIAALQAFNGVGAVPIIDALPDSGALLLEQLQPGTTLYDLDDDEAATAIACDVIRDLKGTHYDDTVFPSIAEWAAGFQRLRNRFNGGTGPFPNDLIHTAESLFQELIGSMGTPILLHADLHHWNVLSAGKDRWLAIDPKGVIGEQEYEIGAWLRNPFRLVENGIDVVGLTERRVDLFVDELDVDRDRVMSWAFAQAVLSAWWSYEDDDAHWPAFLEWAQTFADAL